MYPADVFLVAPCVGSLVTIFVCLESSCSDGFGSVGSRDDIRFDQAGRFWFARIARDDIRLDKLERIWFARIVRDDIGHVVWNGCRANLPAQPFRIALPLEVCALALLVCWLAKAVALNNLFLS